YILISHSNHTPGEGLNTGLYRIETGFQTPFKPFASRISTT
ncbi:MAG: hypothetical protein ACI9ZD_002760, partial [Paracoccaceae bacterium]